MIRPCIYDEFSPLEKVLLVKTPETFQTVNDAIINPIETYHLGHLEKAVREHPEQALEFQNLVSVLEGAGVELCRSDVAPGKPGHTPLFTRDIAVIIGDKVLPSRMRHGYRKGEVEGIYQNVDPECIVHDDRDYRIEGGDFALLEPTLALVGIGPRTNELALQVLREHFPEIEFVPVYPVFEDKAFHIDTVLGIVGPKMIVAVSEWLPPAVVNLLKVRGYTIIEADQDEYYTCATNVLAVDDKRIIAAAENKNTNARLRKAGVDVIEVSLGGIMKRGGGPHCLTLPLRRSIREGESARSI